MGSNPTTSTKLNFMENTKDLFPLPDYSVAHAMMKQQYTYEDLKAAFEAGMDAEYRNKNIDLHITFDSWVKNYKFEMLST